MLLSMSDRSVTSAAPSRLNSTPDSMYGVMSRDMQFLGRYGVPSDEADGNMDFGFSYIHTYIHMPDAHLIYILYDCHTWKACIKKWLIKSLDFSYG
jgi:hypothetical protein